MAGLGLMLFFCSATVLVLLFGFQEHFWRTEAAFRVVQQFLKLFALNFVPNALSFLPLGGIIRITEHVGIPARLRVATVVKTSAALVRFGESFPEFRRDGPNLDRSWCASIH